MSNEALSYISNEVAALFEEFEDDYLVDVFRVWDCDAQNWYGVCPIVFRFEQDDILVWRESSAFVAQIGPVDTSSAEESLSPLLELSILGEKCLSWKLDNEFAGLAGSKGIIPELLAQLR